MTKLPHRYDHKSVSYEIKKYPGELNDFRINWSDLPGINLSDTTINLIGYSIEGKSGDHWKEYVSENMYPFSAFSHAEEERFISLIKYLDRNSMNAAELDGDNKISLTYNDSLRIWEGTGSRNIVLDTTGFSTYEFHLLQDAKDGLFLIEPLNND